MAKPDLKQIRDEIDAVDDQIVGLLARRSQLGLAVKTAKTGGAPAFRPGREADLLRRLADHHDGHYGTREIVRIWREIMSASLALQGKFSVGVMMSGMDLAFWDLARNHFGGHSDISVFSSPGLVFQAISRSERTVAVLPLPEPDDVDPWWRHLLVRANGGTAPRVIAKLPFCRTAGRLDTGTGGLVVALADPEPSGDDISLVGLDLTAPMSADTVNDALSKAGLKTRVLARWQDTVQPDRRIILLEAEGFLDAEGEEIRSLEDAITIIIIGTTWYGF